MSSQIVFHSRQKSTDDKYIQFLQPHKTCCIVIYIFPLQYMFWLNAIPPLQQRYEPTDNNKTCFIPTSLTTRGCRRRRRRRRRRRKHETQHMSCCCSFLRIMAQHWDLLCVLLWRQGVWLFSGICMCVRVVCVCVLCVCQSAERHFWLVVLSKSVQSLVASLIYCGHITSSAHPAGS